MGVSGVHMTGVLAQLWCSSILLKYVGLGWVDAAQAAFADLRLQPVLQGHHRRCHLELLFPRLRQWHFMQHTSSHQVGRCRHV